MLYNSLAIITLGYLEDMSYEYILSKLQTFKGTKRRYTVKTQGNNVFVDDYAHHPTEIKATLTSAKNYPHKQLWCIFQPHTYSRTRAFLDDFADALTMADKVILADIYAAREKDPGDISSRDILERLKKAGTEAYYFPTFEEIEEFVSKNCNNGDMLITMGAGNIVNVGENLVQK